MSFFDGYDETEWIEALEVLPEKETDEVWISYSVKRAEGRMLLTLFPFEGRLMLDYYSSASEESVLKFSMTDCLYARRVRDVQKNVDILEFARKNGSDSLLRIQLKPFFQIRCLAEQD